MKPGRHGLAIWLGSLLAGCAGASTSIRETTEEVALEVHATSAERWCGGKGSLVVGLINPSDFAVNVMTDQWHLEQQAWPGDYSYWYDFSKEEGRGGISGMVACACSHGPCPEPCGGPAREVVIASRTRRDWRIPVEIETLAPGAHTLYLHLRWHDRDRGRSPSPREYQAEFRLLVGEVERDCADVHLGPPNQ